MSIPVKLCTISMNAMLYGGRDKEASWREAADRMDSAAPYKPDVLLLPETFLVGDEPKRFSDPEYIECEGSPMLARIGRKAAEYHAYIAAPVLYRDAKGVHNTLVLFDRAGRQVHAYHKAYPTPGEIERSIAPGSLHPAPYGADFGRVGMAICFDANFEPLFAHYRQAGIRLLLFSSYFPGGFILQQLAWRGRHYVMSSHAQGYDSVVIDDFGRVVAKANLFSTVLCWTVNLDSAILHLDLNDGLIPDVRRRFGDGVLIEAFRDEGMMRLVCNLPDKSVDDVIKECGLTRLDAYFDDAVGRCAAARR